MDQERLVAVDIETQTITWEWHASEYYDAPANPEEVDWLHINDVDRIGEGRYLVSVRNTHQLVIVERGAGVVDVINEERDPSLIRAQHNPQWLGDGAVLVADSENDRVVDLHQNASTGRWEVAWSLDGAGGLAFNWPRDADRLRNGNTLITDTRHDRVVEVTGTGDVVWSAPTPAQAYEADRRGRELPASAVEPYPRGTTTSTSNPLAIGSTSRTVALPALSSYLGGCPSGTSLGPSSRGGSYTAVYDMAVMLGAGPRVKSE